MRKIDRLDGSVTAIASFDDHFYVGNGKCTLSAYIAED
jgi:hypothetical protein